MQAAHCSSIKTYLFNNIEGSFSKVGNRGVMYLGAQSPTRGTTFLWRPTNNRVAPRLPHARLLGRPPMRRLFWNGGGALAGAEVDDRAGDDVVGADLRTVALVVAAAQLAFDADMRALLGGGAGSSIRGMEQLSRVQRTQRKHRRVGLTRVPVSPSLT